MKENLVLLSEHEQRLRIERIQAAMAQAGAQAMVLADNVNLYYLTGRIWAGYAYIPAVGAPLYFVRRPVHLVGDNIAYIRKPEDMSAKVAEIAAGTVALELGTMAYQQVLRLASALAVEPAALADATAIMRQVRAVKTPDEIAKIKASGELHCRVYRKIPALYSMGMTDIELQIAIETASRRLGCLGIFRIQGQSMELFMGNLLAGDNADTPSPYDFTMGGAGPDPSLPVGADGTIIKPGMAVMVDMAGNFNGYMTDMTRTFACGDLAPKAVAAHQCSIDICREVARLAVPGAKCSELYEAALAMARLAGFEEYFMGHHQQAGFIGHGIGIEVNEAPVLAPRSRDVIKENMVIAIEPKFVIPGTGAVGIENTYVATADGLKCLTDECPEELVNLL